MLGFGNEPIAESVASIVRSRFGLDLSRYRGWKPPSTLIVCPVM